MEVRRDGGGHRAPLVELGLASELQAFGKRLVFRGDTPDHSIGLWQSDGTPAGTALLDPTLVNARNVGVANGRIWLTALDGGLGNELWTSDGTRAGTVAVKDIREGFDSSEPGQFVALSSNPSLLTLAGANGPLVFAAEEPLAGREVWKLTQPLGTPQLVANLAPGPQSSRPTSIGVQGSALLVVADGGTGYALWRITEVGSDATPPVLSCPADVTVTTASQGTAVTFPPPSAIDNSGLAPTVTSDHASGDVFPVGTTPVNVTATDSANNASSCAFAITVILDTTAPDAGPIDGGPDGGPGGGPDAGPNESPDAGGGARPDAGNGEVPSSDGEGGCGCAAGSNGSAANLTALALVALVLRRRRRR